MTLSDPVELTILDLVVFCQPMWLFLSESGSGWRGNLLSTSPSYVECSGLFSLPVPSDFMVNTVVRTIRNTEKL